MAGIYSVRLFCIQGLSLPTTLTVPSDGIWDVRCIDIYSSNQGVTPTEFRFKDHGTQATIYFHSYGLTDHGWTQWTGRQVFPPLSALQLEQVGDPVDVTVSGYYLKGVYPL